VFWDGDQKPGFVWVQASFDEVDGGAVNPELSEVLAGVFGTRPSDSPERQRAAFCAQFVFVGC
jgi:hypothetical protein